MSRIAIGGNIGVGKSTLVENLKKYGSIYKEEIDKEILDIFYRYLRGEIDRDENVELLLQFDFLADTIKRDIKSTFDDEEFQFFDRGICEHVHIFAKKNLTDDKYTSYNILQERMLASFNWQPYDKYIILTCDVEENMRRIEMRGREEESDMPIEYIRELAEIYDNFEEIAKHYAKEVVTIDVTNMDETSVLTDVLYEIVVR